MMYFYHFYDRSSLFPFSPLFGSNISKWTPEVPFFWAEKMAPNFFETKKSISASKSHGMTSWPLL